LDGECNVEVIASMQTFRSCRNRKHFLFALAYWTHNYRRHITASYSLQAHSSYTCVDDQL